MWSNPFHIRFPLSWKPEPGPCLYPPWYLCYCLFTFQGSLFCSRQVTRCHQCEICMWETDWFIKYLDQIQCCAPQKSHCCSSLSAGFCPKLSGQGLSIPPSPGKVHSHITDSFPDPGLWFPPPWCSDRGEFCSPSHVTLVARVSFHVLVASLEPGLGSPLCRLL